jgi:plastocyanin
MRRAFVTILLACVAFAGVADVALADKAPPRGTKRYKLRAGPYTVNPGANLILLDARKGGLPRPPGDGYITRILPNLHRYGSWSIPRVDQIHLHHGVWLNFHKAGGFDQFFATGEEKTTYEFPRGFGYPVKADDKWILNYMIHNLTAAPERVWLTYTVDWIPAHTRAAQHITPVYPIWNDVEGPKLYPVFDVHRWSGRGGRFTFPDQQPNAYGNGPTRNERTMPGPGTLISTAGHVHPGGLSTDLDIVRPGAKVAKPRAGRPGPVPGRVPHSVRAFRSRAHYWDKRGPISWDMAMGATASDWRVRVRAGDILRVSATYDTKRASWYEAMGIMVVYWAPDTATHRVPGRDPFTRAIDLRNHLTHGHLRENNHHGGGSLGVSDPRKRPGRDLGRTVAIKHYTYEPGDLYSSHYIPTVPQGSTLAFDNQDANSNPFTSTWHTITSCQAPCGFDTGISYPLANGPREFDSGQLGLGGPPTAGRLTWDTPASLKPGTYTYYCRVHPFMRGAFRVVRP